MALADHLSLRSASVENALLRQMLDAEACSDSTHALAAMLRQGFGNRVEYTRAAHFGIGVKDG